MYVTVVLNRLIGSFVLESNIEDVNVNKFIINWLKTDIGKGKDIRPCKYKEEYIISIHKDKFGNYDVEDNCENRDLRRGILGVFIRDYKNILKEKYHGFKK